jgi:hypothetical protein
MSYTSSPSTRAAIAAIGLLLLAIMVTLVKLSA